MEKIAINSNITKNTCENNFSKRAKYNVRIPLNPLNPTDLYVPVQINGYKWIIKRGEDVLLPKECVDLLKKAGYIY